ncbi:hypothetical protein BDR06DRAFT_981320 [Suillus hirtellus]|nr:hypothetical protein BDR06DRAFT_981320 [Suillus hirtellus]
MFWSDSTHLAQFGSTSTWPLYLFFGNMPNYVHSRPNSAACHPVAFIPTPPSSIKSFIGTFIQRKKYDDVLTHCKCELFHGVWHILLDDDFIHAYKNGIVIRCHDGVYRCIFPRILTYSADYPEKVLLATICDKGNCPCPHYLSQRMKQLHKYFTEKVTQAHNAIYTCSTPIKGDLVESILKHFSLVPTINSFMDRLSPLGFDFFLTLVVDLLHEFKLRIVKAVMSHLMWLLYAIDPWKVIIVDERFRSIPSFGKSSIRQFLTNVSSMKQQVAQHFEDMLQLHSTFEGLFPDKHNNVIRILLFHMAEWHALAKMCLHSNETLSLLEKSLQQSGAQLRKFSKFTSALQGELVHCAIKKFYQMTNKKDGSKQLVWHERQQTRLRQQQQLQTEEPAVLSPELHHHISDLWANSVNLAAFLSNNSGDPALKIILQDFILKLKNHLLSRVLGYKYDGDECQFSDSERNDLHFINNLCWVNYTTYDVQHDQDSMRPGYNCTIMTLSREEGNHIHPFWYVQVLRAFHIQVLHTGPQTQNHSPQNLEVLWV